MSTILITGLPGVGKTTIVKRLCVDLRKNSLNISGFYTEEVRDAAGSRNGFDAISLDGERQILARINMTKPNIRPSVGKYSVYLETFEKVALPVFNNNSDILIIDEIGKMELFSSNFEKEVENYSKKVRNNEKNLVAVIPSKGNIRLIENLKKLKDAKIFTVTKQNRNEIYQSILLHTLDVLKK